MKLDEKVVRKMLKVNPEMRQGRTTHQVKRALEGGQAVEMSTRDVPRAAPVERAPANEGSGGSSTSREEFEQAVGFFVRGKIDHMDRSMAELDKARAELDAKERATKQELQSQLASFVAMLDPTLVALHGVTIFSKHKAFLEALGITPAQLLEAARKGRP